MLWKVSNHAIQTSTRKNFSDYAVPIFPEVDPNINLQKATDNATAIKVPFVLF